MGNPIADSIKRYRYKHKMTQADLARLAGLPRATLANMESGEGNPSLNSALKVAEALGVGLNRLLENKGEAEKFIHVKRGEVDTAYRNDKKYEASLLSPVSAPYTRITSIKMRPGCLTVGTPHPKGSQEFFYCIDGVARLEIDGEVVWVEGGDLIYFPGNLPHSYGNQGKKNVLAVSMVNNFDTDLKKE